MNDRDLAIAKSKRWNITRIIERDPDLRARGEGLAGLGHDPQRGHELLVRP